MILLFSDDGDLSSDYLEDWLGFYKADYIRLNSAELIFNPIDIDFSNDSCEINFLKKEINFKKINVIWNRRWNPNQYIEHWVNSMEFGNQQIKSPLIKGLHQETRAITNYFFSLFPHSYWVDAPKAKFVDKLSQLKLAKKVGMLIPHTIVTSSKQTLMKFYDKHKCLITKPLGEIVSFNDSSGNYLTYTSQIDENNIQNYKDYFFPSIIQRKINKKYEIRTFFIGDKLFSMAIFSQSNHQTAIDFRKYDYVKPNRNIPVLLDEAMTNKIVKFMKMINLKTGSIDFIVSENDEVFFLEVNPVGQYDMVSKPCNYNLDKEIALFLIKQDQNGR